MEKTKDKGDEGEAIARQYLEKHDYEILETNWRVGHLEADIIAYYDHKVIFVEVKTRKSDDYGDPESFVDRQKQRSYIRLANAFMVKHNRDEEVRFDIITVMINKEGIKVNHIPEAFTTVG